MNKYENGKIYTIRCKKDVNLIYVGSTIQELHQRWSGHKRHSQDPNRKHLSLYSSIKSDWNNWYIELYEEYPCENLKQLHRREGQIIREIGTLNHVIAGRTDKEYRNEIQHILKQKTYMKEYQQKTEYKQNRNENIECSCGVSYNKSNQARHSKSNKHLNFLANK